MNRHRQELAALMAALGMVAACSSEAPSTVLVPGSNNGTGSGGGDSGSTTTGPTTGTGADPQSAQGMFETVVYPSLMTSCGDCHIAGGVGTPYFLAPSASEAYTIVKGLPGYVTEPANSRLILKGVHYANQAPGLAPDQVTIVTDWLNMELAENPETPGGPGELTPLQELERFGKCMSYDDWQLYNVVDLSNEQAIYQNNSVECDSCHDDGQSGTWISAESIEMFEATQTMPFILKLAAVTLNTDGTFKDIARSNRWVEKCVETQLVGNPHPPCQNGQLATEVIDSINMFFDATYERWSNDLCEQAVPPPDPNQ